MIGTHRIALVTSSILVLLSGCGPSNVHKSSVCQTDGPDCIKLMPEQLRVLDADSFVFEGLNIRLHEMDAPEAGNRAQCDRERELGDEAKTFVENLIAESNEVTISLTSRQGTIATAAVFADGTSIGRQLADSDRAKDWNRDGQETKPTWCGVVN